MLRVAPEEALLGFHTKPDLEGEKQPAARGGQQAAEQGECAAHGEEQLAAQRESAGHGEKQSAAQEAGSASRRLSVAQ